MGRVTSTDTIMKKSEGHQFILATCSHAVVLIAVAVVLSISLIPTYLPLHAINLDNGNIDVPLPNLTISFGINSIKDDALSLDGLKIVNNDDLARQLISAFHLSPHSIEVTLTEFQKLSSANKITKRDLTDCSQISNNNLVMIMSISINYLRLCGNANYCKSKLYKQVNQSIETYQNDPFTVQLKFNNSVQTEASIKPCYYKRNLCLDKTFPNLYDTNIHELQNGLQDGLFTSVDLVKAYLARIDEVNTQGPTLRAVIEISPTALEAATKADNLRKKGTVLSVLHGIPILLKDNIATRWQDGMNTTAGSYALLDSIPSDEATVTKKLSDSGAIILGKTTLSEWANFRSNRIPSGWSGLGKQATSPFYPQGDACGSSTGSGIAAAIGLAAGTLGTETDGSIICPSSRNNLVGIKPTVGLTSRHLVIPISHSQDSIGPMCRSVADAAAILSIIAGRDDADNYTLSQPEVVPNYSEHLKINALNGSRIGVLRTVFGDPTFSRYPEYIISEFNRTIEQTFKKLGAVIVDPADLDSAMDIATNSSEFTVLLFEFKYGINQYLSKLRSTVSGVKTLKDLIKYNRDHSDLELPFGRDDQEVFLMSENTTNLNDPQYISALRANYHLGIVRGINATLTRYNLDALIAPSEGYVCSPAAIAGYPIITVPLGFLPNDTQVVTNENTTLYNIPIWPAPNFPFGLAFIGAAYTEARLFELAYSYEQATRTSSKGKPFEAAIPKTQLSDIICPS